MTLVFDKCCGCIELRTGCLIIGYLNLVGEIILVALSVMAIIAGGVISAQGKEEQVQTGAIVVILAIIMLIFTLIFFIFTVLLLVGVHQNKRGHVKAYLIFSVIYLVLSFVGWLAGFAAPVVQAGVVVRDLIGLLLSIYFLLVVRSYYIKMDDASKRPAVYNTA